ncbi:MAG: FprA family A-type flavoprotein [Ignavibacteriales bacterium]|nr:FprA family A-type flavoprotein [Ignavibacteriales bacterium]
MAIQLLVKDVFSIGSRDWDRRLFDELIPLPDGTSYNSYLIKGSERTALIDTVDPVKKNELINNVKQLNIQKLDYVISNHAEQDHSGAIPDILELYPDCKVVTNSKCKEFLIDHLLIPENRFIKKEDGESISLGNKTLEFYLTPWVHWPETMVTYLKEDKILFSCDFFGSHFATSDLFVTDKYKVISDAKRYYAEIMMPFRTQIKKNIEKITKLDFNFIAPSHGPVYDNPEIIIDAYKDWISDRTDNTVIIPYISMHGSTEYMANYLLDSLIAKGINVKPFNLSKTDLGELAMSLVDSTTLLLGTSTVLVGPHPAALYATVLVNALKPKLKYISIFGSYGWGGKTVEMIQANLNRLNAEILAPVLSKGHPRKEDLDLLDKLANQVYEKHKELNLIK